MRLGVRGKLVVLSLLILIVVSFSFTGLQITLSRGWFEEDLKERAVIFAREVAATIGDRREFEYRELLQRQVRQIMAVRRSVLQLDVLGFDEGGTHVIATGHDARRLPFTRREGEQVRRGDVVSRMVADAGGRSWEVMARKRWVSSPATLNSSLVLLSSIRDRARSCSACLRSVISWVIRGSSSALGARPIRRSRTGCVVSEGSIASLIDPPPCPRILHSLNWLPPPRPYESPRSRTVSRGRQASKYVLVLSV